MFLNCWVNHRFGGSKSLTFPPDSGLIRVEFRLQNIEFKSARQKNSVGAEAKRQRRVPKPLSQSQYESPPSQESCSIGYQAAQSRSNRLSDGSSDSDCDLKPRGPHVFERRATQEPMSVTKRSRTHLCASVAGPKAHACGRAGWSPRLKPAGATNRRLQPTL